MVSRTPLLIPPATVSSLKTFSSAWAGGLGSSQPWLKRSLPDRVTFGNTDPASASEPIDPTTATTAPKAVDDKPKPHWFRQRVGQAFRVGLNVFHVGVGLFLLAGVPFLHGHLAIALSVAVGLQLLQHYLRHKYPDTTVINPKMMVQAVNEFQQGYQKRVVEGGAKFLRKIPLIRRLEKPYVRAAQFFGEALRKGGIVLAHLTGNAIISQSMPKSFLGKIVFLSQMVLVSFIEVITGPFGKFGKWAAQGLMWLFRLKDTASNAKTLKDTVINALKDFDKPKPTPVNPPPKDPPSGTSTDGSDVGPTPLPAV